MENGIGVKYICMNDNGFEGQDVYVMGNGVMVVGYDVVVFGVGSLVFG